MKTFLLLCLLGLQHLLLRAQQPFFYQIEWLAGSQQVGWVYVEYEAGGRVFRDSMALKPGQTNKRSIPQPVAATIYTDRQAMQSASAILANNVVRLVITDHRVYVQPSPLQRDYLYLTANDTIRPTWFPLYGELSAQNDTAGLAKLALLFDSLKQNDVDKSADFFRSNPASLLSLFAFSRYAAFKAEYATIEADFDLLPDWAKSSPDGQQIQAKITGAQSTQVHRKAPVFSQLAADGQRISIESFRGKYVLLDFWASWCAPCRKEHPKMLGLYERFKDKNLVILSVSLDDNQNSWLRAIAQDRLPWIQLSDLKGQYNEVALRYGVQAIPANFLIGPDGVIAGKNLTIEAIQEMLNHPLPEKKY